MFMMPTPAPYAIPTSVSLAATNSGSGGTVTMPADVQSGDVLVVFHGDRSASPSANAGFTTIASAGSANGVFTDSGCILSYRISDGTEASQSYTGWTGLGAAWAALVWRPNVPAISVNIQDAASYAGTGNPAANVMGISGSSYPTIAAYGIWEAGAGPTGSISFSGDGNDPVSGSTSIGQYDQTSTNSIRSRHHAQSSGGFDITADVGDVGVQASASGYLEIS